MWRFPCLHVIALLPLGALVLVASCGAAVGQAAKTLTPKQIYRKYVDSIVHVSISLGGGKYGTGTGFFFNDGKHIATCYHVVHGGIEIAVEGTKHGSWQVASVRWDEKADVAILQLTKDSGRTPCMSQRPWRGFRRATPVTVVGNPLGYLENSVTVGVVSAFRKLDGRKFLQISAPISHGSSGSPVFDATGRVVGVAEGAYDEGQNLNLASAASGLKNLASGMTWPALCSGGEFEGRRSLWRRFKWRWLDQ